MPMPAPQDELPPLRPMLIVEFEQLIAAGLLDDERVELIDGQMVTMSPQGGPHSGVSAWLFQRLTRQLDERWDVRGHSAVPIGDRSMPEPDVLVAPATVIGRASRQHPRGTVLVVEVSESSRTYDLKVKARIYATGGIPTYWVVDLGRNVVRVLTDPKDGEYQRSEVLERGATLRAAGLDAVAIEVSEMFPESVGEG